VDHESDDSLIGDLVAAAAGQVEAWTGRAMVVRTYTLYLDAFPAAGPDGRRTLRLPMPPLAEVKFVKYFDEDGADRTMDEADYQVDSAGEPARLLPAPGEDWPATQDGRINAVRVQFNAGHADAASCPREARQAVLLLVGHWYENREAVVTGTIATEIQLGVRAILGPLWHGHLGPWT
jgi:uncharacterized phiE125 gp8 family phage protein